MLKWSFFPRRRHQRAGPGSFPGEVGGHGRGRPGHGRRGEEEGPPGETIWLFLKKYFFSILLCNFGRSSMISKPQISSVSDAKTKIFELSSQLVIQFYQERLHWSEKTAAQLRSKVFHHTYISFEGNCGVFIITIFFLGGLTPRRARNNGPPTIRRKFSLSLNFWKVEHTQKSNT